ncbi:ParB/RepB/Spo0J family partition protein [Neoroseomonas soli]|uniref:ParB N-terminal domain-containing protein n=1 Tax=Neoroseomonas soli TaxID=1081025 RepID=A0A9X9WSJ7_9PROT|nr:ParB/RepB/Spo0J family partition protein [Neoroseomonas soli]MBR0670126.1 ParB N-terminal domain-containing protein [Neoroseomonas soli]
MTDATTASPSGADEATRELSISDLLRDQRYQIRAKTDEAAVRRYANALRSGAEMPPVRVAIVDGVPVLVDGHHRVAAHVSIGRSTVMAVIVTAPASEARWLAAQANLEHGLPLKPREAREAFRAFIRARKHVLKGRRRLMSLRDIAKALSGAATHMSIHRWMKKDFPKLSKEYGGGPGPTSNEPPAPESQQQVHFTDAMKAVAQVQITGRAIRDPELRGRLIAAIEDGLKIVREVGPWTLPEMSPDF